MAMAADSRHSRKQPANSQTQKRPASAAVTRADPSARVAMTTRSVAVWLEGTRSVVVFAAVMEVVARGGAEVGGWRSATSGCLAAWGQPCGSVVGPAAGTEVLVPERSPSVCVVMTTKSLAVWLQGSWSVVEATKVVSVGAMEAVAGGGAKGEAVASVVGPAAGTAVLVPGRAGAGLVLGQSSGALRLIRARLCSLGGESQTWTQTRVTSLARLRLRLCGRGYPPVPFLTRRGQQLYSPRSPSR